MDSDHRPPHRTAAVISIGDELILGQTLDTNSKWISDQLFDRGVRPAEHRTVDDDAELIARSLLDLANRCDLILVTGGLGPTADDLTRDGLARALAGEPGGSTPRMDTDERQLDAIKAWFASRPGGMPATNAVQALRPTGSDCLPNPHGTAPGLFAAATGALPADVFCLPGPPREMQPMFDAEVAPRLRSDAGQAVGSRLIATIGLGESAVAEKLGALMDRDREAAGLPTVGTTATRGVVTCRVRAHAQSDPEVIAAMDEAEAAIRERLKNAVFAVRRPERGDSVDVSRALEEHVVRTLAHRGETVSVCESCTGGMIGASITAIPGSSAVFIGGLLTYSDAAKSALADVDAGLIEAHGAVSTHVAESMAIGTLARLASTHALSVTGIAGPGGGSDAKPVGTVCIARASADGTTDTRRFRFKGDRDAVRAWSSIAALAMLRLKLDGVESELLGEVGSPIN